MNNFLQRYKWPILIGYFAYQFLSLGLVIYDRTLFSYWHYAIAAIPVVSLIAYDSWLSKDKLGMAVWFAQLLFLIITIFL